VRLALVIGQLTRGGAEKQLAELALRLKATPFEPFVYVLSRHVEPHGSVLQDAGVPLRCLPGRPLARARYLARALAADRIEIVHAWLYLTNPIAALAARLAGGLPLVTAARNCKLHGTVNRVANAWAFRASRRIIVNSTEVQDFVARVYWAPADRVRIVPNGIDLERFIPADTPPAGPPRIVTVGRLVAQKNHRLFLTAAAELHALRPEVRFAIAGDGPMRRELEAEAARLGVSEVIDFLGERGDVEDVLRGATLFWLTSSWEGMPNVLLEAMACGVPVIASDVSGVRDLIGESAAGVVVPPGQASAWVESSVRFLEDERRYLAARQAARERAGAFSLPKMVQRTTEVYFEALR
jgi:glycosyltransferase involved in cell wall biosynthesis